MTTALTGETPLRNVRVEEALWNRAKDKTREYGSTLSDVMRDALVRYVDDDHVWLCLDATLVERASVAAEAYGTDLTAILTTALANYVRRHPVDAGPE